MLLLIKGGLRMSLGGLNLKSKWAGKFSESVWKVTHDQQKMALVNR